SQMQHDLSASHMMHATHRQYEVEDNVDEGPVGLITYMRTDSIRVADSAVAQAREYIGRNFDPRYLPATPPAHKEGKGQSRVQDAHEAIRPTEVERRPEANKKHLECELFKLYQLTWRRFVVSQLAPAGPETTREDVDLGR